MIFCLVASFSFVSIVNGSNNCEAGNNETNMANGKAVGNSLYPDIDTSRAALIK